MKIRRLIVGAPDLEIEGAKEIAQNLGIEVVQSLFEGKPVRPNNANQADFPLPQEGDCWFECRPRNGFDIENYCICDHHNPGDPGYGIQPNNFLPGSSIGQFIEHLFGKKWYYLPNSYWVLGTICPSCKISNLDIGDCPNCDCGYQYSPDEIADRDLLMTAAADHCLGAAYRGECPGVNPKDLFIFRIKAKAKFQKRTTEEVLTDAQYTLHELEHAPRIKFGELEFVDLRELLHLPELPEVATYKDLAYISRVEEGKSKARPEDLGTGRVKLCASGSYEHIKYFLEILVPEWGLVEKYGNPNRGFAGAYILGE